MIATEDTYDDRAVLDVDYRSAGTPGPGIHKLDHPKFGHQIWVRAKLRKSRVCTSCGKHLPVGVFALRPVTNGLQPHDAHVRSVSGEV